MVNPAVTLVTSNHQNHVMLALRSPSSREWITSPIQAEHPVTNLQYACKKEQLPSVFLWICEWILKIIELIICTYDELYILYSRLGDIRRSRRYISAGGYEPYVIYRNTSIGLTTGDYSTGQVQRPIVVLSSVYLTLISGSLQTFG